jgi:electron-transferring-flavoprotein dehydrogenase
VRSGDKGRGKEGEELGNFEPGTDIKAQATVLAEGCWGHVTGAAIKEFDLAAGREPQGWELGVKEVWKVPKPLDRVIHTLAGWPLKISAKYGQIGGSWAYPMKNEKTGEDLVSIGFIVDLDYADATTSAHDLLQEIKLHPLFKGILEGGERVAWGAKALPSGGYWAMPKLSMPGAVLVGDAAGIMNLASLKGVHYAIKSGMLAAESIYAALKRGESSFENYEQVVEDSIIGKDLWEQRNTRQPFQKGLLKGGPIVNLMIATKGRFPGGRWALHRNDAKPMFIGDTKDSYPKPDGKYTFDKLSSVFITGNATRDDAPNHIRVQKHVPREVAETWRWMCPAGVYEIPEDGEGGDESGMVDVIVNYTNCVQCGAITAKGGRLTTPEGGDGPLYQIL